VAGLGFGAEVVVTGGEGAEVEREMGGGGGRSTPSSPSSSPSASRPPAAEGRSSESKPSKLAAKEKVRLMARSSRMRRAARGGRSRIQLGAARAEEVWVLGKTMGDAVS